MKIFKNAMGIKKIIKKIRNKSISNRVRYIGSNNYIGLGVRISGGDCITIGDGFSAGKTLTLQTWKSYRGKDTGYIPQLKIGNNVSMMDNCAISCMNSVSIGDGCLLGDNVFVTDNFHGNNTYNEINISPIERKLYSKGPVEIGRNVWIGRNVCIMPGVKIGEGTIIGANAVVTSNLPAHVIAGGAPARIIRKIVEKDIELS